MPVKVVAVAGTSSTPISVTPSASDMGYPMMVMSLEKAIRVKRMDAHQTLLQKGDLVPFKPGMVVIFLSHEWTSGSHPDPSMEQFGVFQKVFGASGLVAGNPPNVSSQWLEHVVGQGITVKTPAWKIMLQNPAEIFLW
jgi:hypothetical protein